MPRTHTAARRKNYAKKHPAVPSAFFIAPAPDKAYLAAAPKYNLPRCHKTGTAFSNAAAAAASSRFHTAHNTIDSFAAFPLRIAASIYALL